MTFSILSDQEALRDVVACPALCTVEEYRAELETVFGKNNIKFLDSERTTAGDDHGTSLDGLFHHRFQMRSTEKRNLQRLFRLLLV